MRSEVGLAGWQLSAWVGPYWFLVLLLSGMLVDGPIPGYRRDSTAWLFSDSLEFPFVWFHKK